MAPRLLLMLPKVGIRINDLQIYHKTSLVQFFEILKFLGQHVIRSRQTVFLRENPHRRRFPIHGLLVVQFYSLCPISLKPCMAAANAK